MERNFLERTVYQYGYVDPAVQFSSSKVFRNCASSRNNVITIVTDWQVIDSTEIIILQQFYPGKNLTRQS